MQQAAVAVDDRDLAAEAAHRLRELQSHVTAADHNEVFRDFVQLESFYMSERLCIEKAWNRFDRRVRPGADDDVLSAKQAARSVEQGGFDCFRSHETPGAHDELRTAVAKFGEVNVDQSGDHLAFAVTHGGHIDAKAVASDTEFIAAAHIICGLCGMDDVLAGQ